MTKNQQDKNKLLPTCEDFDRDDLLPDTPQTRSPSFKPAYKDTAFLLRDELRPLRVQLELLKPELLQQEAGIISTLAVFGSSRIPERDTAIENLEAEKQKLAANPSDARLSRNVEIAERILQKSHYYDMARELGRLVTAAAGDDGQLQPVIITGSGDGIMEAANRGAHDAGGRSIGLNIVLPREQAPNVYVTPELSFQFQYFALRKMHFLMRAIALVVFPGGYGTLDELFETLTLIQTKKVDKMPVLLFGEQYWQGIVNFERLVDEGMIDQEHFELFRFVETPSQAWDIILKHYAQKSALN
ncbi:MAG: TIGR00730 family Rossman fold protein [Pseudohongiellaceae bacterium]